MPDNGRRDQQEPVAGEADCSAPEEADLDAAGLPGDARVQALDGRGPSVFADHTHPVHDVALTDRAQLRPVRGEQLVPRLVHRLSDPEDGVLRVQHCAYAGIAGGRVGRGGGEFMTGRFQRLAWIMARSSVQVWLRPRGGGATKFGPPCGVCRARAASSSVSRRRRSKAGMSRVAHARGSGRS
ncbi:hypothetical protein AB0L85_15670 [Streptomyces sp. NPDC052051]|uniref:hypothetical protein n=1 Tax=Streptomyces sp. NPDC052051 TaxID=3154649 RepID=UPI003435D065